MRSDDPDGDSERRRLSPRKLTARLDGLDAGEELLLNDREVVFEVVATDRYSVTVVDPNGNEHTISQNLQTGGWTVNEEVRWVETGGPDGSDEPAEGDESDGATGR